MNPMLPQDAAVVRVKAEAGDSTTLTLRLLNSNAQTAFEPGQFHMVGLPGIGEAPITFSSLPDGREFSHTIRPVGRVTAALAGLQPGQAVQVRGPFGNAWPWEEVQGKNVAILAGGMGIVPLRPFIQRAVANRSSIGQMLILYGARTPEQMLFRDDIPAWREAGLEVRATVDEAPDVAAWDGSVGVTTDLLEHPSKGAPANVALICGPELMMRFSVRALLLRGMLPADIFVSLERHMKCGIGHCGHCQIGPHYVCQDGPVFSYAQLRRFPDHLL
jgi:NAD(P)H-flavin reductase